MRKTKRRGVKVCTVTGMKTKLDNFYPKQTHVKAVDNLRRSTGATKNQLIRMFKQLSTY